MGYWVSKEDGLYFRFSKQVQNNLKRKITFTNQKDKRESARATARSGSNLCLSWGFSLESVLLQKTTILFCPA